MSGDRRGRYTGTKRMPKITADQIKEDRLRKTARQGQSSQRRAERVIDFSDAKRTAVKKRRDEKNTRAVSGVNILSVFIFTLFLIYLGAYFFNFLTKERISVVQVVMGSIDKPNIYNGIIVRDETIYKSDKDGTVYYTVSNFEKVKKDSVICTIQDTQQVADLEIKSENINNLILQKQVQRQDYSLYEKDVKTANSNMKKIIDSMSFNSATFNISALYIMKEKIDFAMDFRNQIIFSESKGIPNDLSAGKNIYDNQLAKAKHSIKTGQSGILAYKIDGLEETLTFDNMRAITKEQTNMTVNYDTLTYGKTAEPGTPIFKIINSQDWYICSYLPAEEGEKLKVNSEITIFVKTGDHYNSLKVIVDTLENRGTEYMAVFKSTKYLIDYLEARDVKFKITTGVTEGYKIPNTAIADRIVLKIPNSFFYDNPGIGNPETQYLKKIKGASFDEFPPMIISKDDEFSYILQDVNVIKLADVLVKRDDPENKYVISEMENIRGVYIANAGIAVFKRINFEGASSANSNYTIIDPSLNSGIKIEDIIILDVKNISENKALY